MAAGAGDAGPGGRKTLQKRYPYDTIIAADNDKKITIVVNLVM